MRPRHALAAALALGLAASPGPAAADEVAEALEAALAAWRAGDAAGAKAEAEWALARLGEAEAEDLSAFLPPAPEGWSRRDVDARAMGAAMFGGGLMASAGYLDGAGSEQATVTLAADSPMVAAMAAVLGNPAAMASMGRPIRAGRHRALLTEDGEVQALIGGRTLVSITGPAPAEVKEALLGAMALDALAAR